MSAFKKTLSIILLFAMLVLLVMLPKYASSILISSGASDWYKPKNEPFTGRITVWHLVGFKPYEGSYSLWLEKYARRIEKRHFGVYLELEAMTVDEARERISKGEAADIISFPAGALYEGELRDLSISGAKGQGSDTDNLMGTAIPIAASCELILYYPEGDSIENQEPNETLAKNYSFEQFKSKKAPCCITDARGAGDMQRLLSNGKADYFSVKAFASDTSLVQFIGIHRDSKAEITALCTEFFELLTSENAQIELAELGLLPLASQTNVNYEQSFLTDAYRLITQSDGVKLEPFR